MSYTVNYIEGSETISGPMPLNLRITGKGVSIRARSFSSKNSDLLPWEAIQQVDLEPFTINGMLGSKRTGANLNIIYLTPDNTKETLVLELGYINIADRIKNKIDNELIKRFGKAPRTKLSNYSKRPDSNWFNQHKLFSVSVVLIFVFLTIMGIATQTPNGTSTQLEVANTPEAALRNAVKEVVGNKLIDIDVQTQYDGGYGVFVRYNASDNLTTKMVKNGIEMTMSDVYIALYNESGQDVRQASVAAYMPLADAYGNTKDGVVYKSVLYKEDADKINFNNIKATLELDIIPGVWNTTLLNVEFR